MNPFVVQNFSSNKGYQFHNKPPQVYPQLVQNSYISSVGRNNMPRYPYHTAGSYNLLPQNPKPLPEQNHMQFGPSSPLFNPIGQSSRSNWIGQNYSSPVNVLNGKVPVQNGYISSFGRNNMLRYPYHTVSSYSQPQNSKPLLAENRLQFGPSSPQFNPIGQSRGLNPIDQNYSSPVNVLNGKVKGLAEYTHKKLFRAKNEMTMKKHPSRTQAEFVVKNLTKSPLGSNTNRTRLLHAFNKNFNLSRPTILDVHDRKRKKIASVEEEVVQNSYSLLNAKGNKRNKSTCEAQNEHNKCVDNPNAMKKTEGQATSKIVIKEDENGYLRVCCESLLESNNLTKESVSNNPIGGSNTKGSLVDKDSDPTDLDLTLHL